MTDVDLEAVIDTQVMTPARCFRSQSRAHEIMLSATQGHHPFSLVCGRCPDVHGTAWGRKGDKVAVRIGGRFVAKIPRDG